MDEQTVPLLGGVSGLVTAVAALVAPITVALIARGRKDNGPNPLVRELTASRNYWRARAERAEERLTEANRLLARNGLDMQ